MWHVPCLCSGEVFFVGCFTGWRFYARRNICASYADSRWRRGNQLQGGRHNQCRLCLTASFEQDPQLVSFFISLFLSCSKVLHVNYILVLHQTPSILMQLTKVKSLIQNPHIRKFKSGFVQKYILQKRTKNIYTKRFKGYFKQSDTPNNFILQTI